MPHIGRRIERIRELKGIKQEALASSLGVSQQTISRIEKSDSLNDEKLTKIADALGVSPEAIENFDIDSAINNINSFYDNSAFNFQCEINPIEKWAEAINENKRLYEELLKCEREKIALLESMLKSRGNKK
ncbi:MAG TPA: helix-turn-helix transcriptional regulator [Edaphocola sp.]|nr:helix-turn-helix transcriptional regulator [Edaphocola sp.]